MRLSPLNFQSTLRRSLFATGGVCFFFLFAMPVLMAGEPVEHPYHVSRAEVAFNAKSGNFEVALCVWPADLEKALSRGRDKSVDLQSQKGLDALMKRYVAANFHINVANKKSSRLERYAKTTNKPLQHAATDDQKAKEILKAKRPVKLKSDPRKTTADSAKNAPAKDLKSKIRWVGHEPSLKQVWLYFEVKGVAGEDRFEVENRMFFELNEDQLNHIQWSVGKKYETFVCRETHPKHAISLTKLLGRK